MWSIVKKIQPRRIFAQRNMSSTVRQMKILMLTNSHNSMSQAAHSLLKGMGHTVMVSLAINQQQMMEDARRLKPELIVCPFLTKVVPEELFRSIKTLIVHPGIVGDRGMSSLDWALLEQQPRWGVTVLEADTEMDAGAIYASSSFQVDHPTHKSRLYRSQCVPHAMIALRSAVMKIQNGVSPTPLGPNIALFMGELKPTMKQSDCKLDWSEPANVLVSRIRARDSQPGVLETINDSQVFLYGAHEENFIKTNLPPKTIIGQWNGAVLIAAGQGTTMWITHMKQYNKKSPCGITDNPSIKLPSTYVLPNTSTLNHIRPIAWKEMKVVRNGEISFVHFNCYNGAMSTAQCKELLEILDQKVANCPHTKIVVICGGVDYFSNGIHLNVIHHSKDPVQESWDNINAINDVVLRIMSMSNKITISALQGNAGAGGAMMALASDLVFAHSNVILNPHYRTIGLHGSEYFTYNLVRKIGWTKAQEITEDCLALTANEALKINFLDRVIGESASELMLGTHSLANEWLMDRELINQFIQTKQASRTEEWHQTIQSCRNKELMIMQDNFKDPVYASAREAFVQKIAPKFTPVHLARLGREQSTWMYGTHVAKGIIEEIKHMIASNQYNRVPGLTCITVGTRADSEVYVARKHLAAQECGFKCDVLRTDTEESDIEDKLIKQIRTLNADPECDGILVQLPLPKSIDTAKILAAISPEKDVDGLTAKSKFIPCTAMGIMRLLKEYDVKLAGKHVCVVGSSQIVGLPAGLECLKACATVTICNVHTLNLKENVIKADVVISAVGLAKLIEASWIKPGAIVIDAGITVVSGSGGKLKVVGDVEVPNKAALITPVPGGCGPMTIAMLMQNTIESFLNKY